MIGFDVAVSFRLRQAVLHIPVWQPRRPFGLEGSVDGIGRDQLARIGCQGYDVEGAVDDQRVGSRSGADVDPHVALSLVHPIVVVMPGQGEGHRGGFSFRDILQPEVVPGVMADGVPLRRPCLPRQL